MNRAIPNFPKMSLNEARSVIWPFREIKGRAFGPLFDSGLLSLQDLRYAVHNAYDPQVREAARVILFHELFQEPPEPDADAPGPLNVVSTERRSFAERRQLQYALAEGAILGGLMAMLLLYLVWSISNQTHVTDRNESLSTILSRPTGIVVLILVLVLFFLVVYVLPKALDRFVLSRIEKQIQLHRKGQLGEERVLNVMYGVLDGKWWLFRNLELPGRRVGDLDLVLVGPHGVWSFEVKAYSGEYRNVGDRWERRANKSWYPAFKNPSQQARRNAKELSQLLSTNQIKQWITPVIVWANPESTVVLDNPATNVWTLEELSDRLKELSSGTTGKKPQVQQIVGVLKKFHQEAAES